VTLFRTRSLNPKFNRGGTALRYRQPFAVMFRDPHGQRLQQDTYQVVHDTLGTFDLFIVPVNRRQKAGYYEAVFS